MISLAKSLLVLGLSYSPALSNAPVEIIQKQDTAISSAESSDDSIHARRGLDWGDIFEILRNARVEICCNHAGGTYYPADPGYSGSACVLDDDDQADAYRECMNRTKPKYW